MERAIRNHSGYPWPSGWPYTHAHVNSTPVEFSGYLLFIKVMQKWTGAPLMEQKAEGFWEGVGTGLYIIYRIYVRKLLKKKKGRTKGTCSASYTKQVIPLGANGVYLRAVYDSRDAAGSRVLSQAGSPNSSVLSSRQFLIGFLALL